MVQLRVTLRGSPDEIVDGLDNLQESLPKQLASSLTRRLKFALVNEIKCKGAIGVTLNLSKLGNWRARTRKVGRGRYVSQLSNPSAPYAGYINDPDGPYPFPIDNNLLTRWCHSKGIMNPDAIQRIKSRIINKGHSSIKGIGFINLAVRTVMDSYTQDMVKITKQEINKAF